MEITAVHIRRRLDGEKGLYGIATVVMDNGELILNDLRILCTKKGIWWVDYPKLPMCRSPVYHPGNNGLRQMIEKAVLAKFREREGIMIYPDDRSDTPSKGGTTL